MLKDMGPLGPLLLCMCGYKSHIALSENLKAPANHSATRAVEVGLATLDYYLKRFSNILYEFSNIKSVLPSWCE